MKKSTIFAVTKVKATIAKVTAACVVALSVAGGIERTKAETAKDAALAMIALRRCFTTTITLDGNDVVVPDLAGTTGDYLKAQKGVNADSILALATQYEAKGVDSATAAALAKADVESARKNIARTLRIELDRLFAAEPNAVDLMLAYGFEYNSNMGALTSTQVLKDHKPESKGLKGKGNGVNGDGDNDEAKLIVDHLTDPHAFVMAVTGLLNECVSVNLPDSIGEGARRLALGELQRSVNALARVWGVAKAPVKAAA